MERDTRIPGLVELGQRAGVGDPAGRAQDPGRRAEDPREPGARAFRAGPAGADGHGAHPQHRRAEPRHRCGREGHAEGNSVSTSSIQDGAVTGAKVANNSLTGVQINEASLAQVPAAAKAGTANNATQLGGTAAGAYVHGVKIAQTATDTTSATLKGPTVATCPSGTRVIGGGAEVAGARTSRSSRAPLRAPRGGPQSRACRPAPRRRGSSPSMRSARRAAREQPARAGVEQRFEGQRGLTTGAP